MWSTREVAELAGTSLRTVRHYHDVGLLNEPARRSNGYKTYGVEHLVRLVWIRRMTGLGFSLAQIAAMDTDGVDDDAAAELDAKLAADIERLQAIREDLRALRTSTAPSDLPPGLSAVATAQRLSPPTASSASCSPSWWARRGPRSTRGCSPRTAAPSRATTSTGCPPTRTTRRSRTWSRASSPTSCGR